MTLPLYMTGERTPFQYKCQAESKAIPLPDDILLVRVLGEQLMFVDAHDRTISIHLGMSGYWESWCTLAIARTIEEGWYCVDVGANCGYYSILAARACGPKGRVLAIEPQSRLADLLRWSFEVNGYQSYASVIEAAVGDRLEDSVPLGYDPHRLCNASIAYAPREEDRIEHVPLYTIDALVEDWPRVDFIKVDVEGAEMGLWTGMQRTLDRFPFLTLVLEVNNRRYADPRAFYESIQARFPLRHIDTAGIPQPISMKELLDPARTEDAMLYLHKPRRA